MSEQGRLAALVRRSYEVLMSDGIGTWIELIPAPDFVWEMTPMGLGRHEGPEALRSFYTEWTSSYEEWFIEPGEIEELSDEVVVNAVRQGGKLRGSEGRVVLDYGQLGLWDGERLKLAANYRTLEEARAEGIAMVARREG
jgi:hypothetical protein